MKKEEKSKLNTQTKEIDALLKKQGVKNSLVLIGLEVPEGMEIVLSKKWSKDTKSTLSLLAALKQLTQMIVGNIVCDDCKKAGKGAQGSQSKSVSRRLAVQKKVANKVAKKTK